VQHQVPVPDVRAGLQGALPVPERRDVQPHVRSLHLHRRMERSTVSLFWGQRGFFATDQTLIRLGIFAFWHQCMEWSNVWVSTKPLITDEIWPGRGLNLGLPNDSPELCPLLHELMLWVHCLWKRSLSPLSLNPDFSLKLIFICLKKDQVSIQQSRSLSICCH
jgi:hypothetical protein